MCFYITATLPKEANIEELKSLFDKYDMAFVPINNKYVESQLRPKELYFRATKHYCDCNTILGMNNISIEYDKLLKSKKVKNLKKKNWSNEQIDKWIKKKIKKKNPHAIKTKVSAEIDQETNNWINFIREILKTESIKRLGILKHWYTKSLSTEKILIRKSNRIKITELSSELLYKFEEDILYEFYPIFKDY